MDGMHCERFGQALCLFLIFHYDTNRALLHPSITLVYFILSSVMDSSHLTQCWKTSSRSQFMMGGGRNERKTKNKTDFVISYLFAFGKSKNKKY